MRVLYTIYMWIVIVLATVFWASLLMILVLFDWGRWSYYFASHSWGRMIVFLSRVKEVVEGLEKIPPGPVIFMSNHQSYWDAISLGAFLPVGARFVLKRVLAYIPFFGSALWLSGHIIVDRENPKQAFSALDKGAEKIKKGVSVFVFPEGTRSRDHRLGPLKKGGFVLAIKAGVPIVPISITGTQSMMPKGRFSFKRPSLVRLRFGDPIATKGYDLSRKAALMLEVRRAIIKGFGAETPEWKVNCQELEDPPATPAA